MRRMTAPAAFLAAAALVLAGAPAAHAEPGADAQGSQDPILWYGQPASATALKAENISAEDNVWQQATLPIGNGDLGGTIYGEISREQIVINEKTLWIGGPGSTDTYDGGNSGEHGANGESLRAVQKLFEEKKNAQAAELARAKLKGAFNRATEQGGYQALADLFIDHGFGDNPTVENYRRDLNLRDGVASVTFRKDGVTYTREMFVSHPNNVMAIRLTADQDKALDVSLSLPTKHDKRRNGETTDIADGVMTVKGALHNNKLKYNSTIKVVTDGGQVSAEDTAMRIQDARSATIYLAAGTDFAYSYPTYRNGKSVEELHTQVAERVNSAANVGWDAVKKAHLDDHRALMDRATINLGGWDNSLATDKLLQAYKANNATPIQERTLEVLLYQYGRYLTVGSSREDSQLPANLQGVWARRSNDTGQENAWKADYHLNVNLQMNYWPTYTANLYESADPLIRYVEGLVEPGRKTAQVYMGTDGTPGSGFSAHTETTPYGWTAPGKVYDWGWSPASVPWILQNVYEAYEFSLDKELLKNRIYPLMKEQSDFFINVFLHPTTDVDGTERLASSPTYSPEHGPVTDGNAYEQMLIWQLLTDTIESAKVLEVDQASIGTTDNCSTANWQRNWDAQGAFVNANANRSWACALSLLKPVVVGDDGQIKEWYDEGTLGHWKDGSPIGNKFQMNHRHMSHMLGLFPGDLITVDNPTYMDAAKVSLDRRTDEATGWGIAQRINSWTRTGDGDRAHRIIRSLFRNGIYPNLFDSHPPFQIDGNFGYTSAVNEMLVQSNSTYVDSSEKAHVNYINVLPAMPKAWASGSAKGLRARGNFTVDLDWADGALTQMRLTSGAGVPATIAIPGARGAIVRDADGAEVPVTILDDTHITFSTEAGKTYTIEGTRSVQIESVTGAHVIGAVNGTLTLRAKVRDSRVTADSTPALTWESSAPEVAKVDNGVVTALAPAGEATISVALADDPAVKATFGVKILTGQPVARKIDDADGAVKYAGRWGTWNRDVRNLNNTLHFSQGPRATAKLTFSGTSVAVYGNINDHPSNILADIKACVGEDACKTEKTSTASDLHQQKLVEFTGLEPGEHTITVSPTNGGTKIELDFFEVMVEGVDRSALQTQLERLAAQTLDPKTHTAESLAAIEAARELAVLAMDSEEATAEDIQLAAEALTEAVDGLAQDETAPTAVQNLVAMPAVTSVVLNWDAATDAQGIKHYEVTGADTTITATELTATIEGLTADTPYSFSVVAVDHAGNRSQATTVETRTTAQPPATTDPVAPELNIDQEAPFAPGKPVRFVLKGLKPLTTYTIELHSDPVVLGTTMSDDAGTLNFEATVPDTVPGGAHTLVVKDGDEVAARIPVTVGEKPANESENAGGTDQGNAGNNPGGADQGNVGNSPDDTGQSNSGGGQPGIDQGSTPPQSAPNNGGTDKTDGGDKAQSGDKASSNKADADTTQSAGKTAAKKANKASDKSSAGASKSPSAPSSKIAFTGWASGVLLLALAFGAAGALFLRRSRSGQNASSTVV